MAAGYNARSSSNKPSAPTPFHHPPRPLPERSRTEPVAVPNVQRAPPPPLPPPRHIDSRGHDLGWQMANAEQAASANGSSLPEKSTPIKAGSSLLGSGQHPRPDKSYKVPERRVDFTRQEVPRSTPAPSLLSTLKAQRPPQEQYQSLPQAQSRSRAPSDTRIPDLRELLDYNKLQSEKQMSSDTLKRSSVAYDKHLLSRIGATQAQLLPNAGEPTSSPVDATNTLNKLNGQLLPLSLMGNRGGTTTPPSAGPSALSPGISGLRSPLSDSGLDHAPPLPSFPRQHQTRSISPHSSQQHYFQSTSSARSSFSGPGDSPLSLSGRFSVNPDLSLSAFRDLRVGSLGLQGPSMSESQQSPTASGDYQASKTGQKRRAQSPPGESVIDPSLPADGVEPWQRASNNPLQFAGRNSRFLQHNPIQSGSSMSTSSSSSATRNSYGSSLGISNPSTTATSYSSERVSPTMYAQAGDNSGVKNQVFMSAYQPAQNSPLAGGNATSQPAVLASTAQSQAQAQAPALSTPTYLHRENNSGILRAPGLYICDCCPKKPKKFESEEELRIHEMEKQYICQYCHNRFKNKNEAERHQNSLHLRRHSWSCSALTSFEAAFHPTPVNNLSVHFNRLQQETAGNLDINKEDPNASAYARQQQAPTDTCGYCGLEFINPPNWDERIEHLNHIHKFGECNQNKKFFRADHFRQHLKHSHAGTSGKWTNVLENACMKDEPPPQPIAPGVMPGVPNAMPGGVPGIAMVGQQALLAAHQLQQQQAQQAAQQAVQHQQQGSPGAPQATMASMLSSALNQQSPSQDQPDQGALEHDQATFGGEVKPEPQPQPQSTQQTTT